MIKLKVGEPIKRKLKRDVWYKLYPKEMMPRILAHLVSREEFISFQAFVYVHYPWDREENKKQMMQEWGRDDRELGALMTELKDEDGNFYLVLVRNDNAKRLEKSLEHEFNHVYNKITTGRTLC